MLASLSIRDFVLIEKLDLLFARSGSAADAGLGALTGETGAGKSILIDALGLALGARAESSTIRRGATQATIAAAFELPKQHAAYAILAEHGMDDEEVLTLRRTIGADGRGRAFVNDQPASVALLRRLGETLVEIQGQMEQHGLLDTATHRASLDAFAGLEKHAVAVRAAWRDWRAAEKALAEAEEAAATARRDEDFLRHAVKELEDLAPKADDEETLATERQMLRAGSALGEAVVQALAELEQGRGVLAALRTAHRVVERHADKAGGRLEASLAALDRALSETTEAQAQLEAARDALEFDPNRLEKIEERLFALRAMARKHNVAVAGLADLADRMKAQLAALDDGESGLKKLFAVAKTARQAYVSAAEAQATARRKGAARLDKAVAAELGPLKLEKAKFVTEVTALPEQEWSEAGTDRVQFTVSTNPGAAPAPIAKIASGGELSRFLLALKVCLAKVGDAATIVFDEVDSGIGGATAAAVGDRLKRLAKEVQVLVVTHSPQVAAVADRHWLIRKITTRNAASTEVVALDATGRREEIARMLSGAEVTAEARAAADRLLAIAG
ncbi:DNA repair protein RecN (Recombination protein N) [Enhydrobacter aerosaccus]|uniref:DNA repair protein RecN n=1 Tax=Enhydrobacter aerosaccus TaxID=225324 RepID=A0A1T4JPT3_9HYPH|nr:DNA repair protein RecN [Enhydrobacter aerosaccus]SJZ32173.1 DNA repair protein RecN (Recombination protein N) [Enhydrobacter aerosaccus]